jgi:hypothetical protein
MNLNSVIITLLRWFTLAGMLFICVRLLHCGLHRRYKVFFAFLLFSSFRSGVLMALDVGSGAYMKFWILTGPVLWIFYILLVLELYSLILESHKGLYTVGRWALWAAFAIAFLSSLATLLPPSNQAFFPSRVMGLYLLTERGLLFSLVVFLLLLLAFLSRYPVVLRRNAVIHSTVYSIFFLSSSLAFLFRSVFGHEVTRIASTLVMLIMAGCVAAWSMLLTPAGEAETRKTRSTLAPDDEQRLIGQLDALNATLLRVARK